MSSTQTPKRLLSPDGEDMETSKRIHTASDESELDRTVDYEEHGHDTRWIQIAIKETLEGYYPCCSKRSQEYK